jgi:putative aldouronate transport system permease protein
MAATRKWKNHYLGTDIIIYSLLSVVAVVTLYPLLYVAVVSLADITQVMNEPILLYPKRPNLNAYRHVLRNPLILSAYLNTINITVIGTILDLAVTALAAYAISKKTVPFRNAMITILVVTMLFNGGLIPTYLTIRSYNLLNKLPSLYLPGLATAYYLFIMKSFFATLPDSLEEAARIDGASDWTVFFRIILPLCTPVLASIGLFYAVRNWNVFFHAYIYISDVARQTLQVVVRNMYFQPQDTSQVVSEGVNLPSEGVKAATVMVAVLPILTVYPFIQKYFVKGMLIGSVKG